MWVTPKIWQSFQRFSPSHRSFLGGVVTSKIIHIVVTFYSKSSLSAGLGIRSLVFWVNRLFFAKKWVNNERMSKRATWANHAQSLICHEWPERFPHSRSFVMSDLSESLPVAHLIWVIRVNEWMSDERMSKYPTLFISNLTYSKGCDIQVFKEFFKFSF